MKGMKAGDLRARTEDELTAGALEAQVENLLAERLDLIVELVGRAGA